MHVIKAFWHWVDHELGLDDIEFDFELEQGDLD